MRSVSQPINQLFIITSSSVATGGHGVARVHAPAMLGHGIRADPKSFLGSVGDGGRTRQQTCGEKHLTTAINCLYISGFWGLPQTSTGLCPWTPLGPRLPTLTSESGYAAD